MPTAVIDMDVLRSFVRSGRARPDVAWDDEAERQWRLAMRQTAGLARSYIEAGFVCVIDVYAPPSEEADEWDELLDGVEVAKVYLSPTYETCARRNNERVGERRLDESALRHNFDTHSWCLEQRQPAATIDNTALTIEETVEAIDRLLTGSR